MKRVLAPRTSVRQLVELGLHSGRWVADISDTNGLGRVYEDACDEGLTAVMLDGFELEFVVTYIEYDEAERELLYWKLQSINCATVHELTLFND